MSTKSNPTARRKARRLALQGIYQWQITKALPGEITAHLLETNVSTKVDVEYFRELIKGVCEQVDILDEKIQPALDRPIEELDLVERAVLRLAVYEFINRIDIPYKVVIDEALRLNKAFGTVDGFKYVNGVLDNIVPSLRVAECGTKKRNS